ncbi:MAG: hypothetical protein IPK16_06060 [Anaerolineales bacterium]|nr:hypothetical protein [Anaerolineales bacterium]
MGSQFDLMTAMNGRTQLQRRQTGQQVANGDDSPDALRRRAEALLDEMMLGAFDMGGGGVMAPHEESAPPDSLYVGNGRAWPAPEQPPAGGPPAHYATTAPERESKAGTVDWNGLSPTPGQPAGAVQTNQAPAPTTTGSTLRAEAQLISAASRYAAVPGATPHAEALPVEATDTEWRPTTSAVRRQNSSAASSMSFGTRGPNRSNLLPRSTDIDANAIRQEIVMLQKEVASALPPGNEAVERSRHLLNKAENLLKSDPTRSAEVDYYLQQVRRIVQRARQTQLWSGIYRKRLTSYLTAWVLLSLVVIAAIILFQDQIQQMLSTLFQLSADSPIVRQVGLGIAIFAGALGAAIAVLLNMRRYRRRRYGFFDRKYGLRGLLLPLLGLLFGLLLAIIMALVFTFAGVNTLTTPVLLWAPGLLAFIAGFSQEWLYGAR